MSAASKRRRRLAVPRPMPSMSEFPRMTVPEAIRLALFAHDVGLSFSADGRLAIPHPKRYGLQSRRGRS